MLECVYLNDLEDVDQFNISGVDRGRESKQGKGGLYVTAVINYKNTFVVNAKYVTVSLALGEGVACNTIFSWAFLQIINVSIMTKKKSIFSGLPGYQSKLDMMGTKISREAPKTSEGLPVSLPVAIPETKNNTEKIGSMENMVELKKMEIHQIQIPGHH